MDLNLLFFFFFLYTYLSLILKTPSTCCYSELTASDNQVYKKSLKVCEHFSRVAAVSHCACENWRGKKQAKYVRGRRAFAAHKNHNKKKESANVIDNKERKAEGQSFLLA